MYTKIIHSFGKPKFLKFLKPGAHDTMASNCRNEGLFGGLHFYFLVRAHMSRMMQRVSELGGVIDDSLKDTTTHAVCDPGCSEKFATEKLGAALPRAGLHLVTPDFISTSIVNGKLQSESNFLPRFVVGLQRNASRKSQRPKVLDVDDKSHGSKASVAAACPPSKRPKRNDDYTITHSMKTPQKLDSEDIGYSSPSADGQCVVERRGSDWVPVRGRLPRFTGGHTGMFGV